VDGPNFKDGVSYLETMLNYRSAMEVQAKLSLPRTLGVRVTFRGQDITQSR
jgi:hypothetical protein